MTTRPALGTAVLRMPIGDDGPRWRSFISPLGVAATHDIHEVRAVLAQAQAWASSGRWVVGMVSYEAAAAFDPALATHPDARLPLAWFAAYDAPTQAHPIAGDGYLLGSWTGADPATHAHAVESIRARIASGDTYQVNYTQRLRADFTGDASSLFAALARAQPTDYSAYLDMGDFAVCSASPELFWRRTADRIVTSPMKGTAARRTDAAQDAAAARALQSSPKERAENVMIVDLLRNDLARVCRTGSVQVSDLCHVHTLPTLHTMTSTVQGRLRPDVNVFDLFTATFPCGSVTGAPKISTMRLIRDLEPEPREVYCGAIGIMSPDGDATFSVAIRTIVVDRPRGEARYGVGGGITYSSSARAEYAELLTKSRVLDALANRAI